jgi:hypothetical protein
MEELKTFVCLRTSLVRNSNSISPFPSPNYASFAVGIVLTYALCKALVFWAISAWGLSSRLQVRPPLYTPFSLIRLSADDKWSAYAEEEMGISVAESVLSESLETSKGR